MDLLDKDMNFNIISFWHCTGAKIPHCKCLQGIMGSLQWFPVVVVVVPFIFISHFSSVWNNFTRAQGPVIVIAKEEI